MAEKGHRKKRGVRLKSSKKLTITGRFTTLNDDEVLILKCFLFVFFFFLEGLEGE